MLNVQTSVEMLTPTKCKELLGRNFDNRRVDHKVVDQYARDIANGDWQLNGETISVDYHGNLINGQHRCLAIVKANLSVRTILVTGLPPQAKDTIDGGKKRSYGDRLQIRGHKHANTLAGSINALNQLATGYPEATLSSREMDRVLEAHPDLEKSVATTMVGFKQLPSNLAAVHYIGTYLGYGLQADMFAQALRDGQATYKNDAAVFYREFILRDNAKIRRTTNDFRKRMFITAWGKFHKRVPMTRFRLQSQYHIKGWTVNELGLRRLNLMDVSRQANF